MPQSTRSKDPFGDWATCDLLCHVAVGKSSRKKKQLPKYMWVRCLFPKSWKLHKLYPTPQKKTTTNSRKKKSHFSQAQNTHCAFNSSFSKGTFFSKTKRRPDLSRRRFFTRNLLSSVGTSLVDSSSFVHPSKLDPGWRRCMRWCVYCVCVCGKNVFFSVVVFGRENIDYILWL